MTKQALRRPLSSLASLAIDSPCLPFNGAVVRNDYHRLLRSCTHLRSLLQIHARILVLGVHLSSDFTCTLLMNSYLSFHKCDSARSVFDSVPNPSVILWNSVIRAYTVSKQHKKALAFYYTMLDRGMEPDKYTYTFVLKACSGVLDLEECVAIHQQISSKRLDFDVYVRTGLVDMYSKLDKVEVARELFEQMPVRDVVAWNAIIAGASQSPEPDEALELFRKMQLAGVEPNSVSLLNLFPAICKLFALLLCKALHGYVIRRVFPHAVFNGLIDMYSKCGNVEVARLVFDRMLNKDEISWGTMISGYTQNQYPFEALELFDDLRRKSIKVNHVSAVAALSAAAETKDLEKGIDTHMYLIQHEVKMDSLVTTALFTMYAKCGNLDEAKRLFIGMQKRDMIAWSAMISVLAQMGHPEEAVSVFREMQTANIRPNRVTIVGILPACGELSALRWGKSIHCYVVRSNMSLDVSTETALVSMYMKCRSFSAAHLLFDRLPHRDVVTWNALINGYAQVGDAKMTMELFHQLQSAGVHPDSGTIVGVLPASVLLEALNQGMCFHGHIVKSGFESDLHVKNALIDMYAKCGSLNFAESLFDENDYFKDEITWNIMIAGCAQNGHAEEAISYFQRMKAMNLRPNLVTMVSILPATSYLASLREGMALHSYVIRLGFESSVLVGNCLIDMYAKCGQLDLAQELFDRMVCKDIVSWNAMLSGYALQGLGDEAIKLFSKMDKNFIEPDSISFLNVLSACRHGGLVEKGTKVFEAMSYVHHIEPNLEHYACMVDLLGRAGNLDKAWSLITQMPIKPDAGVWGALLGACRTYSNVELGEVALDNLARLEPKDPARYVVLSNIYAEVGRWIDVGKMRKTMTTAGLIKTPSCSWIEIKG